ncbi:NmrA family NAD(P)-binding protein [Streptomyces lycii]|uniref:NmrA family NAD(P)-binding protein n=1 Tax=Streptomyces lycii TaxID=2654337 RepID=A0ABQ7FLK1_9ACTN|nr:NmrA family NAD(P)-binding protein [Streptomyces lycii]
MTRAGHPVRAASRTAGRSATASATAGRTTAVTTAGRTTTAATVTAATSTAATATATGGTRTTEDTGATEDTRATAPGRTAAPVAAAAVPVTFDWYDPATHDAALDGATGVYLVPPVGSADPAAVMLPFLDRARRAGVRRAVLLSSSQVARGGPLTGIVHRGVTELFGEWAVLRPSWFMQNFTGRHLHADSIRATGVLTTATGDGRVAFVDAEDIAAVAAQALTDPAPHNTDWVLTGPEALSYDAVAAVVTGVTGRPVRHDAVPEEEMRARLAREMPAEFAAVLAGLDRLIAGGAEDRVTDAVERVTGRRPRSFADHAAAHAEAFTAG